MKGEGLERLSNNHLKEKDFIRFICIDKKKSYKGFMMDVVKTVKEIDKQQKKNEKQKENWMSSKKLKEKYEPLLVKTNVHALKEIYSK